MCHIVGNDLAFSVSMCLFCVVSYRALAAEPAQLKSIRVAIYADSGATIKDVPQVMRCLPAADGFEVMTTTAAKIHAGALDNFDVLIHPGGSASQQGKNLGTEGRETVRRFVANGGGFIGICAGAYLGSVEYPWSLRLLDARVIDDAHWARGQGDVQLRFSPSGAAALGVDKETCTIHFENGPLLGPGKNDDIDNYELLASFDSEIATNGAPSGVMKGTAAIARGTFEKGRVICFSPHPEKTPGLEPFIRAAVRWAAIVDGQPQSGDSK
jgi:glutamine amidotransferase-like uncharacterized protein